jgi:hypothetical protein
VRDLWEPWVAGTPSGLLQVAIGRMVVPKTSRHGAFRKALSPAVSILRLRKFSASPKRVLNKFFDFGLALAFLRFGSKIEGYELTR